MWYIRTFQRLMCHETLQLPSIVLFTSFSTLNEKRKVTVTTFIHRPRTINLDDNLKAMEPGGSLTTLV